MWKKSELNWTFDETGLYIYRVLDPTTEWTFSEAHGTCSKIDNIWVNKEHWSECKRTKNNTCILCHNQMKLEINVKQKHKKFANARNKTLYCWIIKGSQRMQGRNDDTNTTYQSMWHNENIPKKKCYS